MSWAYQRISISSERFFATDTIFRFVNVRSLAWHNFYLQAIKHLGPRPLMSLKALFGRQGELCINRSGFWGLRSEPVSGYLLIYHNDPALFPIPSRRPDHTQRNSSRVGIFFLQSSGCSSIMPLFALIMFPGGSGNGKGTAQLGQDIAAFLSFQLCLLSGNKKE